MGCKPKLRFPEFNGKWGEITLENNAYIKGRIGWKNLKQSEYTEKGPYLIASKHIYNGKIDWLKCDHITDKRYEESIEIALRNGDVIFSKDGRLGNPALIEKLQAKATINSTMMLVRVDQKQIFPKFFYYILNSKYFFKLINELKSGSSIPHIFQRDMINFKFPVTKIAEQQKIASFLSKVDSKIELLEKKQELWETYKKGVMQQIFSQKLRFKDENREDYPEWEEKKLGDVGKFVSGCGFSEKYQGLDNLPIKFFKVSDMNNIGNEKYMFYSNNTVSESIMQMLKSKPIKQLGIIFAKVGAAIFLERKRIAIPPFMVDNNMMVLLCNKETNLEFIYYFLKNIRISKYAQVGALPSITGRDLQTVKINVPVFDEQIKIAKFFSAIDSKVNILNKELELNKEFKKGLLQQMFC